MIKLLENIIEENEEKNIEIFNLMNEKERKSALKRLSHIFKRKHNIDEGLLKIGKISEINDTDGILSFKTLNKYGQSG